ncbi:PH domain-containing protein [Kitasatospora sp. NPDC088134]|uniref:PH domain-containing protein n=1 Tax=Kitasatospora sp. NPDC088134 TaxID=3364071 RepID=UPI0037FF2284
MSATTPPSGAQLPPRSRHLRPPEHPVDPRAVRYWRLRALAGWLSAAAAQVVLLVLLPSWAPGARAAGLALTVLLGAAHLVVMPRRRFAVHRWETTDRAIYTRTGWLVEERRIAPIARVQTIDHERGPLERFLGLTTVTVTTASSAGPLRISGLDEDTAARLTAELTDAARSAGAGDAT